MHTSISKKLLAGLLSVVMVLSLFAAVPANNAQAASVSLSGNSVVSSGVTNSYKIKNLAKTQYAKVSVSGTATTGTATTSSAKSSVSVKKGSKTVKSTTKIAGTGSTISLKVKSTNGWGKSYKLTVKVYNKSTDKLVKTVSKSVKVYKKTSAIALDQTAVTLKAGETATLAATTTPAKYVRPVAWSTSNASVATVADGVVTAVADGTATITVKSGTASATATITVASEGEKDPEEDKPANGTFAISSVTAKKVNILEVAFASAVDTADVSIAVTRGTTSVPTSDVAWNADKTVATVTTASKMIAGTHTVTATSASSKESVTGTVEIEAQKVDQIVIKNSVALTGSKVVSGSSVSAMEAYAYYDVLDQYGESLRTSTTIEWSSSCGTPGANKSNGKLTFTRSDNRAFTYNEQIFVTGVYTKTGVAVTETLTVGAEQALNSIELKGFVKKGTTEVLQSLPAGFKDGEYLLVYSTLDQNGNVLEPSSTNLADSRVAFISDNIMVVKEIKNDGDIITLDGARYCTAKVVPGDKVSDGGEFTVTAIATKTGNKVSLNVAVGEDAILTSFTMSVPDGIIADGEKVQIPFVALDQNGNEIKNFVTLAKQDTFNYLQLQTTAGHLKLKQSYDGSAALIYEDADIPWTSSEATDGIDRTVSLTSVVIGGNSCNITLSISDKARPDAIEDINMNSVYVEGQSIDLANNAYNYYADSSYVKCLYDEETGTWSYPYPATIKFSFYDQYGRIMRDTDEDGYWAYITENGVQERYLVRNGKWGFDNGFFEAAKLGISSSNNDDFKNYSYAIKVTYNGNGGVTNSAGDEYANDQAFIISEDTYGKNTLNYNSLYAATNIATSKNGEGFKFEIVRQKNVAGAEWEATSASKYQNITIVDIAQVKNLEISDLNTFYLATNNSTSDILFGESLTVDTTDGLAEVDGSGYAVGNDYQQNVVVTGTYNGNKITIPVEYYTVTGEKLLVADNEDASTRRIVGIQDAVSGAALIGKLYNIAGSSKNFTRKDADDRLTVKVYSRYDANGNQIAITGSALSTVSKSVTISDKAPKASYIYAYDMYAYPNHTGIDNWTLAGKNYLQYYEDSLYGSYVMAYDEYGVYNSNLRFRISNIVENKDGYAENNFTVKNNDSANIYVIGSELGDTFDLTIESEDGKVSKTVKVTVWCDEMSYIDEYKNWYLGGLINAPGVGVELGNSQEGFIANVDIPSLETQRLAGLN